LALPLRKRLHIGVRFGHKILIWVGPDVCDIWNIMCAYDGWGCSIEGHASRGEVLDPGRELLSLKF
jgi:hypothetical protein